MVLFIWNTFYFVQRIVDYIFGKKKYIAVPVKKTVSVLFSRGYHK